MKLGGNPQNITSPLNKDASTQLGNLIQTGPQGVSIENVSIDEYGHLIVLLSDDITIDAGSVFPILEVLPAKTVPIDDDKLFLEEVAPGNSLGKITYLNLKNDILSDANDYSDSKVADSISNDVTTIAPSQNAVFDALAGKQPSGTYSTDIHDNITALNAVSGSNTGDETSDTIKTKLGTYVVSELDPVFTSSVASGISSGDISNWNSKQPAGDYLVLGDISGKEDTTNKSNDISIDALSTTKYPSVKAIKDYADGLTVGLLDDRGNYDPSSGSYPATGGSGPSGAIAKGDIWYISANGTIGGVAISLGSSVRALVDNPEQTAANWDILNVGLGYVPENILNKVTSISGDSTDIQYPSAKLLYDQLGLYVPYTGATADVNLGTYSLTTPNIIGGSSTTQDLTFKTTTGVGATGADMHFLVGSNGATEALTILNNGNVGIGTTGPTTKLELYGTDQTLKVAQNTGVAGNSSVWLTSVGANNYADLNLNGFHIYKQSSTGHLYFGSDATIANSKVTIQSNGNVGIGTTSPTSILHTVTSGAKTAAYTGNLLTNTATSSTASIAKIGLEVQSTGTWNGTTATNTGLNVNVSGGTTNYAAAFMGGNVGIGTTSPTQKLHVEGQSVFANSGNNIQITSASGGALVGTITNESIGTGLNGLALYSSTNRDLTLGAGGVNKYLIVKNTTGNVGIGTTTPTAVLHLKAGSATAGTAPLKLTSGTLLTTPEAGAIEFNNDAYYGTITTGGKRKQFAFEEKSYVAKTADYTLTISDFTVECTANSFTIKLPTAIGITGRIYNVKNTGTGTITVTGIDYVTIADAQSIDGELTQTVSQWENLQIQSNGANWIIL